jgi:fructose-1,6-bisphosphatase/inositol monophosphatase family enzyme
METLMGKIDGWWSYTAHHWDEAAIAFLVKAAGGVVECLDGNPIPWTSVTELPPVLVAGSREIADRIRLLIASPETNRTRLASN